MISSPPSAFCMSNNFPISMQHQNKSHFRLCLFSFEEFPVLEKIAPNLTLYGRILSLYEIGRTQISSFLDYPRFFLLPSNSRRISPTLLWLSECLRQQKRSLLGRVIHEWPAVRNVLGQRVRAARRDHALPNRAVWVMHGSIDPNDIIGWYSE